MRERRGELRARASTSQETTASAAAAEAGERASSPARRRADVGHDQSTSLAAREQVARARRRTPRRGGRIRIAARRAERGCRRPGRRSSALEPLPERAVLAEHAEQSPRAAGAERAQDEPRLDRAVPRVALEPDRDVVRLAARRRASARCVVRNATAAARAPPPVTSVKRACWPLLAHRRARSRPGPPARAASARVAGAERREPLELLGEVEPERAAGHDGVDALDRHQVVRRERARRRGRPSARRNGSTASAAMLEARPPSGGRRSGRGASAHAASPACRSKAEMLRPEPRPAPARRARSRRTGRQWRSTSRDATIPMTPGCHPSPATTYRGARAPAARSAASAANEMRSLGVPALAVEQVELARDLAGARVVLGQQQLERGVGAAHPPGGVDARPEPEAERVLGRASPGRRAATRISARRPGLARARERRRPVARRCGGSRRAAARGRRPWRAPTRSRSSSAPAGSQPGRARAPPTSL